MYALSAYLSTTTFTNARHRYYPIKDKHKLFMEWYIPSQREHYLNKSENYISWCMGHEGTGSILSKLKKEVLYSLF